MKESYMDLPQNQQIIKYSEGNFIQIGNQEGAL